MADEIAVALLGQVMTLSGQVTERMRAGLERLDLTESVANLVWLLRPDTDPLPLRKLAAQLHCDPSNVTLLSAKLEERGLAERRPHPRDGRVRTLVLTADGRRVREELIELVARHSPLAGLDKTEQKQLHALLDKAIASA
ncbi:MarR family transcriptional regulator [Actinoplanes sp. TRM 88003]|uniref:MarR family transcriptional regulator n=1 Tax=Paractinoplanes aksuensis TaxID=2939490 RepID=A0ABT1E1Z5_9ACTN|nr:MarR family transcriptional regulator [Actinoplanes aksuensis]MCO8277057.1 MarR family transcriptional regulator [Actinoplanes aksuensis]